MFWPDSAEEAPESSNDVVANTSRTENTNNQLSGSSITPMAKVVDVVISSSPSDAQVMIDGENQSAKTPAHLKLTPGEHSLSLTKNGYSALAGTIQVQDQDSVQIFKGYRLQKIVQLTQVVIFVASPSYVTIQVDEHTHENTNRVSRPLMPGVHRLRVSKTGYEPYEREFEVIEKPEQELPPIRLPPEAPIALPVQVNSDPPGAMILAEGQPTGFVTPKRLPSYFSKEDITVHLAGYQLRNVKFAQAPGMEILNFSLQKDIPASTTAREYGLNLTPTETDSVNSVLHKLLDEDWNTNPEKALRDAGHQMAAWERFTNFDPRLSHAHSLLLWHHGKIEEAKALLTEAEKREQNRNDRKVSYYPLTRDKIRLESVTNDEELAVEDLVDLMADTTRMLEKYPRDGQDQALKNAEFAGRLLGYLEGPAKKRLSGAVNPRLIGSKIEKILPTDELKQAFQLAREDVRTQYKEELDELASQQKARLDKQNALQKSGELGRRSIRGKDNRLNGRHDRSDHNAQTVTPFRIPTGPRFFVTPNGVVGGSVGPVGNYHFQNLLFTSGPAVSKTVFNKRTNDLTRYLRKEVKEKLPPIQWRRSQALTTYMPQNLERKRRDLLKSVPTPSRE